jgi:hypothetical protein
LLSNQVKHAANQSTAAVAVAAPAAHVAPTLTAPSASLLPPLPQNQNRGRHGHARRGLLSGWVHDVEGWF